MASEPNSTDTPIVVRFEIEAERAVYLAHHERDVMTDERAMAYVPVGHIDMDGPYVPSRDAFTAWAGEQSQEPPLGVYRLIRRGGYTEVVEFEIREHRERVIERVERPLDQALADVAAVTS